MPNLARLLAYGLTALCALAPTQAQPPDVDRPSRHFVFAHYMTCFGLSVEMAKQEIEMAQRHGIDGFALNCGAWCVVGKDGSLTPTPYVSRADNLYEAARQLDSGFKLFFSADLSGLRDLPLNMGDMVKRYYKHPNQFRHEGKAVISGWAGGPASYAEALNTIKAQGLEVCFVPNVSNPRHAMEWSMETCLNFFKDQPHMDGVFHFACDDSVAGTIRNNATARRATQYLGKLYMAGACAFYNSANLRDYHGVEGYGAQWQGIIRDSADWVELVTWNDYHEDSNLMPYHWKDGWDRELYDHDESLLDVVGYYSTAFKTGRMPPITQDKLYVVYRNRSLWQSQAWDAVNARWIDSLTVVSARQFDQVHDDVGDNLYLTTFLTAPAELTIRLGGVEKTFVQPAGICGVAVPLSPGVPQFTLRRGGETVLDVAGRKEVIAKETKLNSWFCDRLTQRTWTFAAAAGPALHLAAAGGKVHGNTTIVMENGVSAVATTEKDGSGFTVPVKGLETATYNVRIVYSNPGDSEARLTLTADGPPRAKGEYPHYIPAFLPPTGKGKFLTTSFFWSLYEHTTALSLQWLPGTGDTKANKDNPLFNDHGCALVAAIELVKVDPVQIPAPFVPTIPDMVPIPGGEFVMGTNDGKPDEAPTHKVKLSPFAIGKYTVTNEEYEKFDPRHRQFRDGYSWRDREPVIYVSWLDGAKYCNWLSRQAGLIPAYAEKVIEAKNQTKTLVLDIGADGFQMPSEAQWEYVATGRGEGRLYPWGDVSPDSARGNFAGVASLAVTPDIRSHEAAGVMTVGAYPAGASRDGVMDLAGNVCTWCGDWYQPYAADNQSDPCNQTPSAYRSLRGGSWDYYNYSQRCAAREFNSPGYGGYIYIGLRVALPEAGWRKINAKAK